MNGVFVVVFVDDKVIEILQKLPSEGPSIDYKVKPYKENQNQAFLRDVIAMLNSEQAAGDDKFIIVGVTDEPRLLKGIELEQWRDDNEWQNLIKKISPRPDVRTGYVKYRDMLFGYIYIPGSNSEWVYEASESVVSQNGDRACEKNIIAKGQAYTRIASVNEVLMANGRKKLLEKKIQQQNLYRPYVSVSMEEKPVLLALALVGGWNEKSSGDIKTIEALSGRRIEDIKRILRNENSIHSGNIKYSNGHWSISAHLSALLSEADNVFDDHIDLFFEAIRSCLLEIDPKCDLPANQRSFSALLSRDNHRSFSDRITAGLAETLAILGNHNKEFVNCSRNKILYEIYRFEREIFRTSDWRIYATITKVIQLLGEACPDAFMDEISRLLRTKDCAFLQYLSETEDSITTWQYGYEIGNTLSIISKKEEYFSKAMSTLLLLSAERPEFIDIMVGIVLPWYPQTHASSNVRIGVFKGLAQEDANLTWDILMKLMPGVVTTGSPIQRPKYLEIDEMTEQVTPKDYYDVSIGYIRLAEDMIGSDINRMCDMISVIDDVDITIQQEILGVINNNSKSLDDTSKAQLWNALKDFIHKHRKFSDVSWALEEERISDIEDLANKLIPDDSRLNYIRLFRKDQYSLFMGRDSYSEEELKIKREQICALEDIYTNNGLDVFVKFVESVENKRIVGARASTILKDDEVRRLIRLSIDVDKDEFLEGLMTAYQFDRVETIIKDYSDDVKVKILYKLPLSDKLILYVKSLNLKAQEIFWKKTNAWGYTNDSYTMLEDTISSLNQYHRTKKSIDLMYYGIFHTDKNVLIQPNLVIETLKKNVDNQAKNTQNEYQIQQLIKWLQERNTDKPTMLELEWKYLAFLKDSEGYPPINLWQELSENPRFFIWIVKIICGKENNPSWSNEDKQKIMSHCYDLLYSWKRVPGLDKSGKINKESLDKWFCYVKQKSIEFDISGLAMNYFGQAAFHSPADADGFFIDREVAKYLQFDIEGAILSGYHSEAINSRGVYCVDYTGETEFKIEESYIVKAHAADENGLFRLAETLRNIAASYHEDGLRNKELRLSKDME